MASSSLRIGIAGLCVLTAFAVEAQTVAHSPIPQFQKVNTKQGWLAQSEKRFGELDVNHDDKISKREGQATTGPTPPVSKERWMQKSLRRFQEHDQNHDEVISDAEEKIWQAKRNRELLPKTLNNHPSAG